MGLGLMYQSPFGPTNRWSGCQDLGNRGDSPSRYLLEDDSYLDPFLGYHHLNLRTLAPFILFVRSYYQGFLSMRIENF